MPTIPTHEILQNMIKRGRGPSLRRAAIEESRSSAETRHAAKRVQILLDELVETDITTEQRLVEETARRMVEHLPEKSQVLIEIVNV